MALVKYDTNATIRNQDKIITDLLTIDNKDLLLVSLLEKLCQVADGKNILFKKICKYLHKIGIIDDPKSYSDHQQVLRKLYTDYMTHVIGKMSSDRKSKSLKWMDDKLDNKIQVINSQYSNAFIELEKIGNGGFGEVYKSYNYIDAKKYAIKKVPFFDVNDPNNMRAFNEVRCLASLSHENIVRYHTTWLELCDRKMEIMEDVEMDSPIYPVLYIQMELCMCSLRDYMIRRNYSGKETDFTYERKCINGIINGLKYIHENKILHRDLNPNNIFLDEKMIPKIGDFGMSIKIDSQHEISQMSSDCGVGLYVPPEYKGHNIYTEKSDVYSAGIIFFELLHIFSTDMERLKIVTDVRNGIFPIDFANEFPTYYKLISKMLTKNPDERISTENLYI